MMTESSGDTSRLCMCRSSAKLPGTK
uniref:Uncharacterized protein n=1 Tax=Anguilla anguilla TaxID=7936 RepID=A0A0E9RB66_ANGAN